MGRSTKHVVSVAAIVVLCAVTEACKSVRFRLSGRPCENGACGEGYVCNPQTDICAPAIVVGCSGSDAVCPERTASRAFCDTSGSFLPCVSSAPDCAQGCRICLDDHTWSLCSRGDCTRDVDGDSVVDCVDVCESVADAAQADQDGDGRGDACDVQPAHFDASIRAVQLVPAAVVGISSRHVLRGALTPPVATAPRLHSERFLLSSGVIELGSLTRRLSTPGVDENTKIGVQP